MKVRNQLTTPLMAVVSEQALQSVQPAGQVLDEESALSHFTGWLTEGKDEEEAGQQHPAQTA